MPEIKMVRILDHEIIERGSFIYREAYDPIFNSFFLVIDKRPTAVGITLFGIALGSSNLNDFYSRKRGGEATWLLRESAFDESFHGREDHLFLCEGLNGKD